VAARRRDAKEVRRLMLDHIDEAGDLAAELDAALLRGLSATLICNRASCRPGGKYE
jgi:hypothetical protein